MTQWSFGDDSPEVNVSLVYPCIVHCLTWIGVGMMRGGEIMPDTGCGLITPGIGWKPMAELVIGVKSDVFLGEVWLGEGLPPPWIRVTS